MSARSIVTFSDPPPKRGGGGGWKLYLGLSRPLCYILQAPPLCRCDRDILSAKKWTGGGLEIVTWTAADGYILQATPLCRFSLHVLADSVDQPRNAADVSMGEIARTPGLDTPKLHFVESGPYMCQHDPTNK